jgi:hypothetical protein
MKAAGSKKNQYGNDGYDQTDSMNYVRNQVII